MPRLVFGGALTRRVAPRIENASAVDGVIAELREIDRRTGVDRVLAIGELILNRFFGGDPRTWRDRRRNKNNSIRRLASRADCPFCRSALNEAVGVYVAVVALPCVRTFGHISASHVASVLGLPPSERASSQIHIPRVAKGLPLGAVDCELPELVGPVDAPPDPALAGPAIANAIATANASVRPCFGNRPNSSARQPRSPRSTLIPQLTVA